MPAEDRAATLARLLQDGLDTAEVTVRDDSDEHLGHPEAGAGGHYHVKIRSARFAGLSLAQRHRLVYAAVGDLGQQGIHALGIDARTPHE